MTNTPQPAVIEVLAKALDKAKRGEISSVVLLTLNGARGHVGRSSCITSLEDAQSAPEYLKKMEGDLRDNWQAIAAMPPAAL